MTDAFCCSAGHEMANDVSAASLVGSSDVHSSIDLHKVVQKCVIRYERGTKVGEAHTVLTVGISTPPLHSSKSTGGSSHSLEHL